MMLVDSVLTRFCENLLSRPAGPMKFRFVLQPAMSIFFAVRGGLQDARAGKPPYFWAMFTDPTARAELLREGWKSVGKIFILAIVLDCIYQVIVLHFIYPLEAVVVAVVLAFIPYLIVRGPVNRIARRRMADASKSMAGKK